jgi:hypothetical protein
MLASEFITCITQGQIDRVRIYRPNAESGWSIYAYGENLPAHVVKHLTLNEQGSKRLWSDLIVAHAFIRKSGFTSIIEIDG